MIMKFTTLYQSFGIECRIGILEPDDLGYKKSSHFIITLAENNWCSQECETLSDKFGGYISLYTSIFFDKHGKFITQVFLE